ncbi:MAG TPA: hypothetical protein VM509_02970, partial [Planctomycetota bacterium]|nr:hypothetical protein [Planctomycetota bacterium]
HIRAKDGTGKAGATVGITCGDARPRTMHVDGDGAFRFEGLAAGRWFVVERIEELDTNGTTMSFSDDKTPIAWSCEVRAGVTTYHDVVSQR